MIRGVIWRNLWNPGSLSEGSFYYISINARLSVRCIFLVFFHKMSQCGTFEVTLFSAISGGNDWMNYGSVLRLGHRGSISCRNRILSESDHRITKKNTTKSAEAPMLSQGLERCTSWFLSLDFHLKNCWTSWYPLMFSGILSPGGETLHKHFILLDHVVS